MYVESSYIAGTVSVMIDHWITDSQCHVTNPKRIRRVKNFDSLYFFVYLKEVKE